MDNILTPLNHQDNSEEPDAWFLTAIVFIEYTVLYLSPFSSLSVSILEAGEGGDTCASVWTSVD